MYIKIAPWTEHPEQLTGSFIEHLRRFIIYISNLAYKYALDPCKYNKNGTGNISPRHFFITKQIGSITY
jgi:hypothetical protein